MNSDDDPEQAEWTSVDRYLSGLLHPADPVLENAVAACDRAGLPPIQVSATLGKLLHLLARLGAASRILEIGTLGGYSTIWLARALPSGGRLVTIELEPAHARVAKANLDAAGLSDRVELRVGAALDLLPDIAAGGLAPFDLVFIDADKENGAAYLDWALRLSRPGSLIIVDNVIRAGHITDAGSADSKVQGSRAALEWLGAHEEIDATAIQTVGSKGYDGFAIAIVGAMVR